MAANPPLVEMGHAGSGRLMPALFAGERLMLERAGVKINLGNVMTKTGSWKSSGTLFLSDVRLVFVSGKADASGVSTAWPRREGRRTDLKERSSKPSTSRSRTCGGRRSTSPFSAPTTSAARCDFTAVPPPRAGGPSPGSSAANRLRPASGGPLSRRAELVQLVPRADLIPPPLRSGRRHPGAGPSVRSPPTSSASLSRRAAWGRSCRYGGELSSITAPVRRPRWAVARRR